MTTPREALSQILYAGGMREDASATTTISGEDPVLPTPFRIGAAAAASIAAVGIAANELWCLRGGSLQQIELDQLGVAAALRSEHYYTRDGKPAPGVWHDVSGFYQTRDARWVQLHCNHPNLRRGMAELLGVEENRSDFESAVAQRDALDLEAAAIDANLCAAAVRGHDEWSVHPHAKAIAELPLLEVLKIGESNPEPLPPSHRPLAGLRVLDLTHVIAGPLCGRTLAEHGAVVLRLSAPHLYNLESIVLDTGHGKLSAFLDLRHAPERNQLLSLARNTDVVVQGFRPGALANLGLAPQDLIPLRPGLIYVSLSAFSHAGPWAQRRGFDSLLQSTTGIAHQGDDSAKPKHLPAQALDYVAGYLAAFGATVALSRRAVEGGSYLVRVSLAQTGRWIQSLGSFDSTMTAGLSTPTRDDLAQFMTDCESPYGKIRHVAPVLKMSETPPRWERFTAPYGTHPAAWPS